MAKFYLENEEILSTDEILNLYHDKTKITKKESGIKLTNNSYDTNNEFLSSLCMSDLLNILNDNISIKTDNTNKLCILDYLTNNKPDCLIISNNQCDCLMCINKWLNNKNGGM